MLRKQGIRFKRTPLNGVFAGSLWELAHLAARRGIRHSDSNRNDRGGYGGRCGCDGRATCGATQKAAHQSLGSRNTLSSDSQRSQWRAGGGGSRQGEASSSCRCTKKHAGERKVQRRGSPGAAAMSYKTASGIRSEALGITSSNQGSCGCGGSCHSRVAATHCAGVRPVRRGRTGNATLLQRAARRFSSTRRGSSGFV